MARCRKRLKTSPYMPYAVDRGEKIPTLTFVTVGDFVFVFMTLSPTMVTSLYKILQCSGVMSKLVKV